MHTLRLWFAIDVADLDADLRVLRTVTMRPNRLGRPVWAAQPVLEAEAGSFARWGLQPGCRVEVVDRPSGTLG